MQQYADTFFCKVTLHVSGVTAPIFSSTKNSNRGLQYRSRDWCVRLAQTSTDQATLQGSSCTGIMTCTGGCGYSF